MSTSVQPTPSAEAVTPKTAITVTEKAAGEVRRIIAEQRDTGNFPEVVYLRLRVVGGGCSVIRTSSTSTRPTTRSSTRSSSSTACRSWSTSAA